MGAMGSTENQPSAGERLGAALSERGAAAQLAKELGVDPSLVTRWVQRTRRPNTAQRVHSEQKHGIPILDWDEGFEESSQEPAA